MNLNKTALSIYLLFLLLPSLKSNAQFSVGLRTGVNYEMKQHNFYHTPKDISKVSWSQQLVTNWIIGKHFLLEVNLTHATFNKDIYPVNTPPGVGIAVREQSFNVNSIFSYKLISANRLSLYGGLGLGIYTYTTKSDFNLDVPSAIAAISGYYTLNQRIKLTAQPFYSILLSSNSGAAVSNTGLNVGATLQL